MDDLATRLTTSVWETLGGNPAVPATVRFDTVGALPSIFAVTDLASAAIATASLAVAELIEHHGGKRPLVRVDRRLASVWFRSSLRPLGWALPAPWDPIAGDYRTNDGWIRLHTNAPHHRAAAERVLAVHADRHAICQRAPSHRLSAENFVATRIFR